MKSVVVEIKNDFAAILSDDGSIVKVKNKNYVVGQVIIMKKQRIHITKKLALGVASAAVLILSGSVGAWAYTAPYSYVSLDVNPSIEYTLNRFERVIDVKAVNDDGQVILSEIDIDKLTNKSIETAILNTVKQISQDGYFSGTTVSAATGSAIEVKDPTTSPAPVIDSVNSIDGGIIITVANGNTELSEDLAKEIGEAVDNLVQENVEVEVTSVGYDRVQEAKKLGMTPGKLNLIQKLQASSANPESITIEDWKNKPVKEIMKAIKANKKAALTAIDTSTTPADSSATAAPSASPAPADTTNTVATPAPEATVEEETKDTNTEASDQTKASQKAIKKEQKAAEKAKAKEQKAIEKEQKKTEKTKAKVEKNNEKANAKAEKVAEKAIKQKENENKQEKEVPSQKSNSGKGKGRE